MRFLVFLQPDITAPGLNVLAAWSEGSSPTKMAIDHRVTKYNILSGTSMSCPHIGGAAALMKAIHPSWSSAAIRSAIMTTGNTPPSVSLCKVLWKFHTFLRVLKTTNL